MDNFVDERDYKILENDKYTFFVLARVMGENCELLLTDHERLIVCFTGNPYPIWVWTPDDATEKEMERAYRLVAEHGLLNGANTFNLKYDLAAYFIKRSARDNKKMSISLNMYAYDCPEPVQPKIIADGVIHQCNRDDLEELVDFLDLFHKEIKNGQKDRNHYRLDAEKNINAGNTYFWKDGQGNNVASCKFIPKGNMASLGFVFTRPEFRRKHYAENLVYQVTKRVRDAGYVPMLYTDADYTASNSCYEKIGYVLRGKLFTIA